MKKKATHEEEQQILEAQAMEDMEDQKVDLKILEQSPEAIQRELQE